MPRAGHAQLVEPARGTWVVYLRDVQVSLIMLQSVQVAVQVLNKYLVSTWYYNNTDGLKTIRNIASEI